MNDRRLRTNRFNPVSIFYELLLACLVSGCGVSISTPLVNASQITSTPSWSLDQTYQLASGMDAVATSVQYTSDHSILSGGYALDSLDHLHWLIQLSDSSLGNPVISDNYQLQTNWDAIAHAVNSGPDGTFWAAGEALDSTGISHWIVRTQPPSGSWSTDDDFQYQSGSNAAASSLVIDSAGDVFVAGYETDSTGAQQWVVREKPYGGSWTTSDHYQPAVSKDALALSLTWDSTNLLLYASGYQWSASGKVWVVRKLSAGTWSTIDLYQEDTSADSVSLGLTVDVSGNLYATGSGVDSSGYSHWITRALPFGGSSWEVVDNYQLGANENAYGQSITASTAGGSSVYVAGYAFDNNAEAHWTVRSSGFLGSFSTLDDYTLAGSTQNLYACSISVDSSGDLAVMGSTETAQGLAWMGRIR